MVFREVEGESEFAVGGGVEFGVLEFVGLKRGLIAGGPVLGTV